MSDKHEWEYGAVMQAIESWALEWLGDEAQCAFLVGPGDLEAAAARKVEEVALGIGWWKDADGIWRKPIVPGRD